MAGKAGRSGKRSKSAQEALTVVSQTTIGPARPKAPGHLTEAQRAEWTAVVDACPTDWFPRETHGLLEAYCMHIISARDFNAMIDGVTKDKTIEPLEAFGIVAEMAKARDKETRAASSLATRLRITNQALTNHKVSRTPGDGGGAVKKPWET